MKKQAWPIVAMVAIFALGFLAAVAMRRPVAVEVHTGPSAATSIILFLLVVLGVLVGLAVAVVVVWQVLRAHEQTRRMQQAALLFGAKNTPARPARPAVRGSEGGTVIMIGGGEQPRVEDLR